MKIDAFFWVGGLPAVFAGFVRSARCGLTAVCDDGYAEAAMPIDTTLEFARWAPS